MQQDRWRRLRQSFDTAGHLIGSDCRVVPLDIQPSFGETQICIRVSAIWDRRQFAMLLS
jgi:hypothetical protein